MNKERVAVEFPFESKYIDVLGSKIHYIEQGSGDPILFLHGMPASNYVWRNIIPHLSNLGRCIAPDLIGTGKSDKPDIQYTISDHIKYIEGFIKTLNLKRLILVMHGWGSIIGFSYAMKNENNCRGLAFYEAYLRPVTGQVISLPLQEQISLLEQQGNLEGVDFVDHVLPQSMMRELSSEEMTHYREPFMKEGAGKALQQYFNELPRENNQTAVDQLIDSYSKKLTASYLPKLMLYSIPGFITAIATIMWAKEHLHNLEIAEIGEDLHFAQESNPTMMGETISIWVQGIEQTV